MDHFFNKVEGWFTFPNLYSYAVSKFSNGSKFIEIGSWLGQSATYMAVEIANSTKNIDFYCVDLWENNEEYQNESVVIQNNRPLIASSKNVNSLKQKFDYVTQNWYDVVVEILYEEIQRLEDEVVIVLGELGVINSVLPESIFLDEETSDNPKDGSQTLT
jgi:hypothetical protein